MSLVKWTFVVLLTLPAAELVVLLLATATLGWFWTFVLLVGGSLAGIYLLRQTGRGDLDQLRQAFAREGLRAIHLETPGFATMLGAILLTIPGFITDIVGLGLFVPAIRRWAAGAIGRAARRRPQDQTIIDLEPNEWRQLPDPAKKRRRKPKSKIDTKTDTEVGTKTDAGTES
jgi:UPF0716 protein FxsA